MNRLRNYEACNISLKQTLIDEQDEDIARLPDAG